MSELQGARIHINGVVQGVGFRPFVYGLAQRHRLSGWVCNTSAGVDIEVEGPPDQLQAFVHALTAEAPPLARIDAVQVREGAPNGFATFEIKHSQAQPHEFQPISPDVSICPDCLRELFDPNDRRYRYPFINCTNCGPRFTIIKDVPYDRPLTTMAPFEMCPDCAREYHEPLDRRFHAQPVACPACGPHVWMVIGELGIGDYQLPISNNQYPTHDAAIQQAIRLLTQGQIVAVKGLGGFHLACDATNDGAVLELRRRKGRVDKPFALMMPDMATVEAHCFVNEAERDLLTSRERPIVLLQRRADSPVSRHVAPHQNTLGVMLPYTPLHYLLMADGGWPMADGGWPMADGREPSAISHQLSAIVLTSGNYSEEPIATDNEDALARLARLADAFLLHDRDIHVRTDDSVVRVFQSPISNLQSLLPIRRSRGYAPFPVKLPFSVPPILAVGGELKNTFCVTRDRYAFLSHHVGDMENLETLQSFEAGVAHFEALFRIAPEIIAHDMHPDYMATRYARARAEREGLPAVAVQHHHAHVAACLAENGHDGERPVIGVSFDGAGFGPDGAVWGGEFLIADYAGFERAAYLAYVPLPGGDKAVREPWRMALAWLKEVGIEWTDDLPPVKHVHANLQSPLSNLHILHRQLQTGLNSPPTSSMGRLFDAVASLVGLRQEVNYEGQAAIELEAIVDAAADGAYKFALDGRVDAAPAICAIVKDVLAGVPAAVVAARFHAGVARMVRDVCLRLRKQHGLNQIALSGGVFQNITLLEKTIPLLREAGFEVFTHRLVPPNDGGLALGQALVALATR